ncbi:DUF805 domain-containing protein [Cohaesibacter haloalkalitolerans]|uniref:DUF805 domain-containing protein n=1 Tax=Cohaesibacter haloalkalitolerans TaxID=1162980 RepID=UPI000E65D5C5|nr:DUF805 domain-containing protein [Cohaesibacter haloalkalitolerans]
MFSLYGKLFSILRASFSYSGRTARMEFWLFLLFYALMYFAALGADVTYFQQQQPGGFPLLLSHLMGGREPFVWLHLILLSPAMIAITVRRLHDRGHKGWWGLVYLVPFFGLFPMVAMLARKGQQGFNRFGANPLDLAALAKREAQAAKPAYTSAPASAPSPAE